MVRQWMCFLRDVTFVLALLLQIANLIITNMENQSK